MFVYADYLAEALTLGTGTDWRVEGKQLVGGLFKSHAVGLKTHGEVIADVRWQEHETAFAMSLVEGCLGRVYQSGNDILGIVNG